MALGAARRHVQSARLAVWLAGPGRERAERVNEQANGVGRHRRRRIGQFRRLAGRRVAGRVAGCRGSRRTGRFPQL